jgi:hypothetical protein
VDGGGCNRWPSLCFHHQKKGKKMECKNKFAGSVKNSHEPRRVGHIITEMFLGNSPIANGYRKFIASEENSAEKGGEL